MTVLQTCPQTLGHTSLREEELTRPPIERRRCSGAPVTSLCWEWQCDLWGGAVKGTAHPTALPLQSLPWAGGQLPWRLDIQVATGKEIKPPTNASRKLRSSNKSHGAKCPGGGCSSPSQAFRWCSPSQSMVSTSWEMEPEAPSYTAPRLLTHKSQ